MAELSVYLCFRDSKLTLPGRRKSYLLLAYPIAITTGYVRLHLEVKLCCFILHLFLIKMFLNLRYHHC